MKKYSKYNIEKIIYENGYKYYIIDGLKYTNGGTRLTYTPDIHENHGKMWTDEEKAYLVQMKIKFNESYATISAALGKTYASCSDRFMRLKKLNQIDKYLKMDLY